MYCIASVFDMVQILHIIDFEGTRTSGVREYGVVSLIDWEIQYTNFSICEHGLSEHLEYFTNLRRIGSFVGHNASVEDRLLRHYAVSPGCVRRTSESDEIVTTWAPWIDTKVLYKNFFRSFSNFSLKSLIEETGQTSKLYSLSNKVCELSRVGYHNALFDALATGVLLQYLVQTLKSQQLDLSIDALIEYSKQTKLI